MNKKKNKNWKQFLLSENQQQQVFFINFEKHNKTTYKCM